ncbi:NAD-dependent epimerase/dehydratase family protein [Candidatus Micrarchaeota archaeon]|nr:NAD-dependent epimerase/dehydratase family protein [Candidatus Micrarchaeota archaeon]MBU2476706.1 NAD-dependent epimerase/dehydratase family protein [Candidatus Micrarchaeota archaeon]
MGNCLIIGGNGFIGRHLTKALLKKGFEVEVLDVKKNMIKGVNFIEGSITDKKVIKNSVRGKQFVFHLASTTFPASSMEKPVYDAETNLLPAINIFRECTNAGVKKLFFPSSGGAIYGNIETEKANEKTPVNPQSPHAIIKLAIENYLNYFWKVHGLDYACLRIGNAYGPEQNTEKGLGFVSKCIEKAKNSEELIIYGDGLAIRDFVYIDDIVNAFILATETKTKEKVFNIGSGEGKSIKKVISSVENLLGKEIKKKFLPLREGDIKKIVLDISLAKRKLGYEPKIMLEEGIRRMWYPPKT